MCNDSAQAPAQIVLASSSRYRAELLQRLRLPFHAEAAAIDESRKPGESAESLVVRLSREKAEALRPRHPHAWILGSDQVAVIGDRVVGKPGSMERAAEQLRTASGQAVRFLTGVVLLLPERRLEAVDVTTVYFRTLDDTRIRRYLDAEPALDCAGSFKCEGYGISLFEAIESRDPTALIGLPLIEVCRLLRSAGYPLP